MMPIAEPTHAAVVVGIARCASATAVNANAPRRIAAPSVKPSATPSMAPSSKSVMSCNAAAGGGPIGDQRLAAGARAARAPARCAAAARGRAAGAPDAAPATNAPSMLSSPNSRSRRCIQRREVDQRRLARHLLLRVERDERAAAAPASRAGSEREQRTVRKSRERRQPRQRLEIALQLLAALLPAPGSFPRTAARASPGCAAIRRKDGEMLEVVADHVQVGSGRNEAAGSAHEQGHARRRTRVERQRANGRRRGIG